MLFRIMTLFNTVSINTLVVSSNYDFAFRPGNCNCNQAEICSSLFTFQKESHEQNFIILSIIASFAIFILHIKLHERIYMACPSSGVKIEHSFVFFYFSTVSFILHLVYIYKILILGRDDIIYIKVDCELKHLLKWK